MLLSLISIHVVFSAPKIMVIKEEEEQTPYLGADEVIEEVITLLARLEKDRQETEDMYNKERDKAILLAEKINTLSSEKLRDMPLAVQQGSLIAFFTCSCVCLVYVMYHCL